MIFVTVGTDHHKFERLFKELTYLSDNSKITDKLIVQFGSNNILPEDAICKELFPFDQMLNFIKQAKIIITHASSTAILAIKEGKVPIVVPRKSKYNEAVDNHQIEFVNNIGKLFPMIIVYNISELGSTIENYDKISEKFKSNYRYENKNAYKKLDSILKGWGFDIR